MKQSTAVDCWQQSRIPRSNHSGPCILWQLHPIQSHLRHKPYLASTVSSQFKRWFQTVLSILPTWTSHHLVYLIHVPQHIHPVCDGGNHCDLSRGDMDEGTCSSGAMATEFPHLPPWHICDSTEHVSIQTHMCMARRDESAETSQMAKRMHQKASEIRHCIILQKALRQHIAGCRRERSTQQ